MALADAASAYGVYLLRGMFAIVSFLGVFGRVVAVCPPQVAGLAHALVVSASNLAVSLGAPSTIGCPFKRWPWSGLGTLWWWVRG
ncbi:hypothetical protein PGN35_014215 [Nodosilinea sp. PGN35]|uniref:hypothetical protein n=1 Tax=Nodosilinea sp. PGN35 TaxID=3020489 RepID=UPI0023B22051|nr:hypothetical protein [Nodosilinea sp. TSF1-S3]MDF0364885.1 hypothetical protein [Nodosilinea sp. TSF1-S3]